MREGLGRLRRGVRAAHVRADRRPGRLRRAALRGGAGRRRDARIRATCRASTTIRSELVIPLMLKERCIGVFDLASAELDAFSRQDVQVLTPLANMMAVAIENARLYEAVAANEHRLEKEVRFAQRVQHALLPQELPKRLRGVDVAARFDAARELGGDFHDFLDARAERPRGRGRRRLGQGRAGRALQRVRRRAGARPHVPPALHVGAVVAGGRPRGDEHHPPRAAARGVRTARSATRRSTSSAGTSRWPIPALPYPIRCTAEGCAQVDLPGVPLGSFSGIDLRRGDLLARAG